MEELLPGVTADMLQPAYWLSYDSKDRSYSIDGCNARLRKAGKLNCLTETNQFPVVMPSRPTQLLYNQDGEAIDEQQWDAICASSSVRRCQATPGFAVRCTDVRRWATHIEAYRSPFDREFDQFQDTTLHTFEPIVIVGESADGQWVYVYAATYRGFVVKEAVALTSWTTFAAYQAADQPFAVVTAPQAVTEPQPYDGAVSRRWVEFAARLPLAAKTGPLGRQSSIGQTCVLLPVRGQSGELEMHPAYLRSAHVHVGWLPFRRATVLEVAFSLLHERYGWGGRLGVHDCSSFVMDVYRTMGVQMPRDAGAQEVSLPTKIAFPVEMMATERGRRLAELGSGDLLYMPGHTMVYLGAVGDRHYVIHDFAGYVQAGKEIPVNQVMVSTLNIETKAGKSYLASLTTGGTLMGI